MPNAGPTLARKLHRARWWYLTAVVLTLSCKEHLPTYADPQDLFATGLRHQFVYSQSETVVYVSLVLVNQFDETLEAVASIDGTITVALTRDPSTLRTFRLSAATISFARSYEPATGVLRVDAGDSVVFKVRYDFMDDGGRSLIGSLLPLKSDPNCIYRMFTERESYVVHGNVTIFPRSSPTTAEPYMFRICVPVPWVSDKVCLTPLSNYDPDLCP